MCSRPNILVVEDDDRIADMLSDHLSLTVDAELTRTRGATETLQLDDTTCDLMLVDLLLPDGNGLDLIRILQQERNCPVLLMTGKPTLGRAVEALRLGVKDLFTKPFDLTRLTRVVQEQLAEHQRVGQQEQHHSDQSELLAEATQERQALQERLDLLCKDLVGAYRNLAEKFTDESQLRFP